MSLEPIRSLRALSVQALRYAEGLIMIAEYILSRLEGSTKSQEPCVPIGFNEQIGGVDMKLKVSIKLMRRNKLVTKLAKSWFRGSGRDKLMMCHHVRHAFFS
jgi:hypothetical protein